MPRSATEIGRSISRQRHGVLLALLGASLLWAYWPTLVDLHHRWSDDPRYSHGYLVPLFSLFLLWWRRNLLSGAAPRSSVWGILLIAAGAAKFAGARFYYNWFDAASLLPTLAGITLLLGGWPALRWAWPSIAFLIFMIPLPYRVEFALGYPLQRTAVAASTYALETLELPALAEGNIIVINDVKVNVAEACNGLGMLFMFFAYAVGAAIVVRRTVFEKALIVASAAPIAVIANVARIVLTGVLMDTVGQTTGDSFYHDLSGWLMTPLAFVALYLELQLLSHLFIAVPISPAERPTALTGGLIKKASSSSRHLQES
jgi:exosortase